MKRKVSYFQFMKSILSLLCFLSFNSVFAQQLISYKLLPCSELVTQHIYRNRIISQTKSGDSLILEIGFTANCSVEFTPSLTHQNDTLFLELTNISETYAACDCCYSMLFYISDSTDTAYKLFVDKKEFKFSKSRYIDFPPSKISEKLIKNETNTEGKKIGYWKIKKKHGFSIYDYGNGSAFDNFPLWSKEFNSKNELVSVSILMITYDITESYYSILGVNHYLKIVAEIEATR